MTLGTESYIRLSSVALTGVEIAGFFPFVAFGGPKDDMKARIEPDINRIPLAALPDLSPTRPVTLQSWKQICVGVESRR
jgi:hypothetical protein